MSKEEVKEKARKFLEAVSQAVRVKTDLTIVETGMWWSAAKPGVSNVVVQSSGTTTLSQSSSHQREVFNTFAVNTLYQTELIDGDFPEKNELYASISAAGIEATWISYGFLLALVHEWCRLPEPLDLNQSAANELLETFAAAVVEHESVTTYRDAIIDVDLGGEPLIFEEGITIRPISEDELYELSREKHPVMGYDIKFSPSDNWSILEVQIKHPTEDSPKVFAAISHIREALIADLALADAGSYTLLPLGQVTNFGINTIGSSTFESRLPREFGRTFPGKTTTFSPDTRHRIVDIWPRVKEIMIPGSRSFALPLRRLVDALGRARLDDKVVDCSIGLEALLTDAVHDELKYRFALRGAMILGSTGYDRSKAFSEFKDLYDARSTIVHGGSVAKLNLGVLADNGERLLRTVWDWYFGQDLTIRGANNRIDRQILASGEWESDADN